MYNNLNMDNNNNNMNIHNGMGLPPQFQFQPPPQQTMSPHHFMQQQQPPPPPNNMFAPAPPHSHTNGFMSPFGPMHGSDGMLMPPHMHPHHPFGGSHGQIQMHLHHQALFEQHLHQQAAVMAQQQAMAEHHQQQQQHAAIQQQQQQQQQTVQQQQQQQPIKSITDEKPKAPTLHRDF
ncbi:hypothetical protein ACTFIW_002360 [Dictyostelium discoideum]